MSKQNIALASFAVALICAQAPVAAQTVLKIGYTPTLTSHYGVGASVLCEEIEKGTAGRYKCQHFPSGSLGGEREMIEAVQLGTLDIVNTSTGPVGNFVPEVKIVDIPFLFRDYGPCAPLSRQRRRSGIADQISVQRPDCTGLDRERFPSHDQQQARHREARRCRRPVRCARWKTRSTWMDIARLAFSPRRWPSLRCSAPCSKALWMARKTRFL